MFCIVFSRVINADWSFFCVVQMTWPGSDESKSIDQACRSPGARGPCPPPPPRSKFWLISWPYFNHGAYYALNITNCPHRIFNPSYGPESLSSRLMMLAWYSNFLDPLLRITYYTTELYYQHSSSTNLATATLSFIIFHTEQCKKLSIRWVLLKWLLSM